jgi:hypothetical protein
MNRRDVIADRRDLTTSELAFEAWCLAQNFIPLRIRKAHTPGHKRPDYALQFQPHGLLFVEIKELDETPEDAAFLDKLQTSSASRWVDPCTKLRGPIKAASAQLQKVSRRGFPTVVCLFDKTIGFYLEPTHVLQAMFGHETLRFEVSDDPAHKPRFLGARHGKRATLTSEQNTSVSAVAVMRQPFGSPLVIDLYHNPHARVPIRPELAAPLVRKQYGQGLDDADRREPNMFDWMRSPDRQAWRDDPIGECNREIEAYFNGRESGRS